MRCSERALRGCRRERRWNKGCGESEEKREEDIGSVDFVRTITGDATRPTTGFKLRLAKIPGRVG